MQIVKHTLLDLAKRLAGHYGVAVRTVGSPPNPVLSQRLYTPRTTPFDAIEEAARVCRVMVYDGFVGALLLAQMNAGAMVSGFSEGVNIERAQGLQVGDQRYSDVAVFQTSNNLFGEMGNPPPLKVAYDPTVPRFRKLIVFSEQASLDLQVAKDRATLEVARRYGRSQPVTFTIDSWRDRAGTLWHVNTTVPVNIPHLRVGGGDNWLIAQVRFRRDRTGMHADITHAEGSLRSKAKYLQPV